MLDADPYLVFRAHTLIFHISIRLYTSLKTKRGRIVLHVPQTPISTATAHPSARQLYSTFAGYGPLIIEKRFSRIREIVDVEAFKISSAG